MINLDKFVIAERGNIKELSWGEYTDNTPNGFELMNIIYGNVGAYSDEGVKLFKRWCVDNNVHFYARPREKFFAFEAWEEAERAGAKYVLMEDLS